MVKGCTLFKFRVLFNTTINWTGFRVGVVDRWLLFGGGRKRFNNLGLAP